MNKLLLILLCLPLLFSTCKKEDEDPFKLDGCITPAGTFLSDPGITGPCGYLDEGLFGIWANSSDSYLQTSTLTYYSNGRMEELIDLHPESKVEGDWFVREENNALCKWTDDGSSSCVNYSLSTTLSGREVIIKSSLYNTSSNYYSYWYRVD